MKKRLLILLAIFATFVFSPFACHAHTQSCGYLNLITHSGLVSGEWHVSLRDLDDAVGLDVNEDGSITWGELNSRKEAVTSYLLARLHIISTGTTNQLRLNDFLVDEHSDGAYAVLCFYSAQPVSATKMEINYTAFFDIDPKHRGLLQIENNGTRTLGVFSPESSDQTFEIGSTAPTSSFFKFVNEGIWHIWTGYDHILFLLALLLPGVLLRENGEWRPVSESRKAFLHVLKIVTSFTLAHSITLSLAALGYIHLPSRLVESSIAASVIIAAFNNLVPFFAERGWMVAFGFGLLHGFGFANSLNDLGLHHIQLASTLFGFNIGVEIGQLAIVAVFLPLALSIRQFALYRNIFLRAGSVGIMALSTVWLAERVLDFKWLPF